jgi:hypothetical protein
MGCWQTRVSPGLSDFSQPGAERDLFGDEISPTRPAYPSLFVGVHFHRCFLELLDVHECLLLVPEDLGDLPLFRG